MNHLLFLLLIISIAINTVSVVRWREAEAKLRAVTPQENSFFDITKEYDNNGTLKRTVVVINKRQGIPIIADLSGRSIAELADMFDEAEKNGKPCIFETKDFKA